MKKIQITITNAGDESLVLEVLNAFRQAGKITFELTEEENPEAETFDKNDEEILDLLDQADREKGVPYEELRKRFGL